MFELDTQEKKMSSLVIKCNTRDCCVFSKNNEFDLVVDFILRLKNVLDDPKINIKTFFINRT